MTCGQAGAGPAAEVLCLSADWLPILHNQHQKLYTYDGEQAIGTYILYRYIYICIYYESDVYVYIEIFAWIYAVLHMILLHHIALITR